MPRILVDLHVHPGVRVTVSTCLRGREHAKCLGIWGDEGRSCQESDVYLGTDVGSMAFLCWCFDSAEPIFGNVTNWNCGVGRTEVRTRWLALKPSLLAMFGGEMRGR